MKYASLRDVIFAMPLLALAWYQPIAAVVLLAALCVSFLAFAAWLSLDRPGERRGGRSGAPAPIGSGRATARARIRYIVAMDRARLDSWLRPWRPGVPFPMPEPINCRCVVNPVDWPAPDWDGAEANGHPGLAVHEHEGGKR